MILLMINWKGKFLSLKLVKSIELLEVMYKNGGKWEKFYQ